MLGWTNQFNICSFLDNHQYHSNTPGVECLVACGSVHQMTTPAIIADTDTFMQQHQGKWIFGHLGYDTKNQVEVLQSAHPDDIQFPDIFFYVPAIVLLLQGQTLTITCYNQSDPEEVYTAIRATSLPPSSIVRPVLTQARMSKEDYISTIEQLRKHIQRGDCYEINYCQEFFAEDVAIDPMALYRQLTQVSPNPFSCYYRLQDKHLLCASPERFLQKKGAILRSQPIKGTVKRNLTDALADYDLIQTLRNSEKDKSENVMVVDLVRNDLSKVCQQGTVSVTELFGIDSFPQVHQMISTIEGKWDNQYSFAAIIKACFPMGSMTGAPKKRVMELIEQYEKTKRGLYSGAVGYIAPDGDFDFNVVIRSILYNATNRYLSYQVGGGITFYSDPEKEYEECLLKAAAIRTVLEGSK